MGCEESGCTFRSKEDFDQWVIDSMQVAREAFVRIGKPGVQVLSGGMTGTTTGLGGQHLSCEAVEAMEGKVVIDHYPNPVENMTADLKQIKTVWQRDCPEEFEEIVIGEFGGNTPEEIKIMLQAFLQERISKVNYWVLEDGDTGLLQMDGTLTELYEVIVDAYSQ
jgi:hypothetical protein